MTDLQPSTPLAWGVQVTQMYQWPDIALRTSAVYRGVMSSSRDDSMVGRLKRYYKCGAVFGKLCCCVVAVSAMYLAFLEWWEPALAFDLAPDFALSASKNSSSRPCGHKECRQCSCKLGTRRQLGPPWSASCQLA